MAAPALPTIRLGPVGTGLPCEKLHRPASRRLAADRPVNVVTTYRTPWRQPSRYRDGVRHIARIRLLRGDIARAHGAVRAASSTTDAPSDFALDLVFTGGAMATAPRPAPRSRCGPNPTACGRTAPRACSPDPSRSAP